MSISDDAVTWAIIQHFPGAEQYNDDTLRWYPIMEATLDVTGSQIEFFNKLLEEKEYPAGTDKAKLRQQFTKLNKVSASAWIEKSLTLPKADDSGDETVAPPF